MGNVLYRFILSLSVLGLVAVVVFVLVELLPGAAATATAYLGQQATPDSLAAVRLHLGGRHPVGRSGHIIGAG